MRIAVVGTGYVGLVSGTCFADMGNEVICVDKNIEKIEKLKRGIVPIYEPGLEELVEQNMESGRLKFTSDIAEALDRSDFCFIAVGTPMGEDGSADLRYVLEVAEKLCDRIGIIRQGRLVEVGATEDIVGNSTLEDVFLELTEHQEPPAAEPDGAEQPEHQAETEPAEATESAETAEGKGEEEP